MIAKLDNPVWHSLNETHAEFSLTYGNLKFYHPDYCPFGAYANTKETDEPTVYSKLIDSFFIVGEEPQFSTPVSLKRELVCQQMIIENVIAVDNNEKIVALNEDHRNALFELVNLVQPGYFKLKSSLLGNYYGIFKNGSLVAATGERMKMNAFTEISAIVTRPGYTGNGYAKQLIAHAVNGALHENKIPYLHVVDTNSSAIGIYERLGFKHRRKISFWNFKLHNFKFIGH